MKNAHILTIRHFDDLQDLSAEDRNNGIIAMELLKVDGIVESQNQFIQKFSSKKIKYICSPQKRCTTTVKAICEAADSRAIEKATVVDSRIRDMIHGSYVVPEDYSPGADVPSLEKARKAYVEETFIKENLLYRHGDPLIKENNYSYPALVGQFTSFGENQRDFSCRFYSFLIDLYKQVLEDAETMHILVTHSAIIFRLYELQLLFARLHSGSLATIPPGKLAIYERQMLDQVAKTNMKEISAPGELRFCDITYVSENIELLEKEIDFLQGLH